MVRAIELTVSIIFYHFFHSTDSRWPLPPMECPKCFCINLQYLRTSHSTNHFASKRHNPQDPHDLHAKKPEQQTSRPPVPKKRQLTTSRFQRPQPGTGSLQNRFNNQTDTKGTVQALQRIVRPFFSGQTPKRTMATNLHTEGASVTTNAGALRKGCPKIVKAERLRSHCSDSNLMNRRVEVSSLQAVIPN